MSNLLNAALEALEAVLCDPEGRACINGSDADLVIIDGALSNLRAAIAEAEKAEPFGYVTKTRAGLQYFYPYGHSPYLDTAVECVEVFTAPPKREPLTDEQAKEAALYRWLRDNTHPVNMRKLFNGCPVPGGSDE